MDLYERYYKNTRSVTKYQKTMNLKPKRLQKQWILYERYQAKMDWKKQILQKWILKRMGLLWEILQKTMNLKWQIFQINWFLNETYKEKGRLKTRSTKNNRSSTRDINKNKGLKTRDITEMDPKRRRLKRKKKKWLRGDITKKQKIWSVTKQGILNKKRRGREFQDGKDLDQDMLQNQGYQVGVFYANFIKFGIL